MRTSALYILFLFCSLSASAQYNSIRNKTWTFGGGAGLDFTTGAPVAITSSISASEGCAMVSDNAGILQFYTDGDVVFNRLGAIMPSGSALTTNFATSTSQGALIVPVLGSSTLYYIFSVESYLSGSSYCRLLRATVDMSLAGGLGAVTSFGLVMDSLLTEKMIAIPGDNCNIWLMVHKRDFPTFLAYNITSAGVSTTPVVSNVGTFVIPESYAVGMMKSSPDRTKIVAQAYDLGFGTGSLTNPGTELYDFSPLTGIVSNCRVLDSLHTGYGAEFSPDNTKLYTNEVSILSSDIIQYDVTLGSAAAIRASRNSVANVLSSVFTELKLAPNDKIYLNAFSSASTFGTLDCIANPNQPGAACNYTPSAVALAPGTSMMFGLPNVFYAGSDTIKTRYDTSVCLAAGASITIHSYHTAPTYTWSTGATSSTISIPGTGTYWVLSGTGCNTYIDTIRVLPIVPDTVRVRHDSTLCSSTGGITISSPALYTDFIWSTGATTSSINITTSGLYWVKNYDACNNIRLDTFMVIFDNPDTLYNSSNACMNNAGMVVLNASPGATSYLWFDGSTGSSYTATAMGTYWVRGTSQCDLVVDTFRVYNDDISFTLGNDTTICVGYMLQSPLTGPEFSYLWQNGDISAAVNTDHSGMYALTITKHGCSYSDTVNITIDHFSQNIPDTFICKGEVINVTVAATPPPGGHVMWNDGDTNSIKTFTDSGDHWVFVSRNGCEILDTVRINTGFCNCWFAVPDAFTPNNDGTNDRLKPLMENGCTISGYEFLIFNRWGQEVYRSDFFNKTGWDGTFNGVPCEMGVYMYALQFFIGVKNIPVSKGGNITLIR